MIPISICIIAKNEEKHLAAFFAHLKQHMGTYPYEIVFVDTGSTDPTRDIAQKYADQVWDFPWADDFSAARNFSISKASHDWILVLDCDEYITQFHPDGLEKMILSCPLGIGMIQCRNHYSMNGQDSIYVDDVERFFHRDHFHYQGIIHEQVVSLSSEKIVKTALPLTVEHWGYQTSQEKLQNKVTRNNTLLLKMLEQDPEDPYVYFQLGQSYNAIHDAENACFYYGKGLEFDIDPKLHYVQLMVIGYGYSLLDLHRYKDALCFQNIYEAFKLSADFLFLMGLIYMNNAMFEAAISEFLNATQTSFHFVEGINSYLSYYNIGVIYECSGSSQKAMEYYQKCGKYTPALEGKKRILNSHFNEQSPEDTGK